MDKGKPNSPCAVYLGGLFGGQGAVMGVDYSFSGAYRGFYPEADQERKKATQNSTSADRQRSREGGGNPYYDKEHLYWYPHLYGNETATAKTDIYLPAGYSWIRKVNSSGSIVIAHYKQLGNLSNVTLAIMHVADFRIESVGDRTRIGRIGGEGGSNGRGGDIHSHFQLWRGRNYLKSVQIKVE